MLKVCIHIWKSSWRWQAFEMISCLILLLVGASAVFNTVGWHRVSILRGRRGHWWIRRPKSLKGRRWSVHFLMRNNRRAVGATQTFSCCIRFDLSAAARACSTAHNRLRLLLHQRGRKQYWLHLYLIRIGIQLMIECRIIIIVCQTVSLQGGYNIIFQRRFFHLI